MSDDTPPWESKPAKQEALYIHWCMHEGCKKWGSWGFNGRYGVEWFCFEHKDDGAKTPK
ncbi:hypothetical protein HNQ68_002277 [Pseudochrobactrum saccharolyticum]|uniref:Uncharacterized protein n=1 Tax=Pseudochrobactrum saccharolyticum TaxID=354352 RepID=A0A7W8AM13_9HYPH|nr:hypothetical protein [Pseudochrobactrum saccharolyticum]MBB5091736.1 hypothetical protein [Pseudochrobactrum saccharolyticum]MBX8811217.1 hypothetical protein [Ochrobactrum sp. MR34]